MQSNFNDTEHVSTLNDHKKFLLDGQHLPSPAKITNIPFREGIGPSTHTPNPNTTSSIAIDAITDENLEEPPQISSDQSRGGGGASWVNPRKHAGGATRVETTKHNFRDLGGGRNISLVSGDEESHLPIFQDAGGVPQHRKVGYRPMVDGRPVPGTPRKGANAMWRTKAKEDEGTTVGTHMWPRGPGDPFWKTFPPLKIDKPPAPIINDQRHGHTRACDIRDGNHGTPLRLRGSVGI